MMRDVLKFGMMAQPTKLLVAAGCAAVLAFSAPVAVAQSGPAQEQQATQPAKPPTTPPPAAGQPTVTPPAGAVGPAEAPPPPPAVGPDGNPVPAPGAAPADGAVPVVPPPAPEKPADGKAADGALHDLSPYGMFMQAHIVVKFVMLSLILASIVTWALLISKWLSFGGLNSRTDRVLRDFRDSKSLQDAAGKLGKAAAMSPAGRMLLAAADELRASGSPSTGEKREHLTSRISSRMAIAQAESNQELGAGMLTFATTGSISPFVGLFGTVWGIMNSFIGIAQTQTTNLAVVAPGIAEALFATAIGLFAAIPAVIFYNMFARRISSYNTRLENFSGEVLVRLSRQLDAGA